jgi:protein tyrosine/serine phosphatase
MRSLISFLFLFPMMLIAGPMEEDPEEGNIPRFGILVDGLYRGGQPTEKGFHSLKEKGVKTVINLRAEDNSEEPIVENLGMKYIRIPIQEILPWSQIPPGAIAKYFELVNNSENYPIFFHCRRGADRTGALAALYRMAVQGWNARKAYEEARNIGMRWYFAGLKAQINDFHPPAVTELQPAIKKQ